MFTRNDQHKRWANGTLGKVTKLTKDEISVTLNNGETYVVPCCSWESYSYDYNKEERKMKKELTGTFTQYPLKLAWAITVHKSQGSKYRAVILSVLQGSKYLLSRNVLYTALTRARELLILVGDEAVIAQMTENNLQQRRYSGLKLRLQKGE